MSRLTNCFNRSSRRISTALLIAGAAILSTLPLGAQKGRTVSVPQFQFEKDFIKGPLPNGWVMGGVGAIEIDSRDHVWLLTRPRELPEKDRAKGAPPVIEFDNTGKFVRAWGGAGAGYEWPGREHALGVDPAGFIWIGGNAGDGSAVMRTPDDDVLIKFTLDGKLVKQYGHLNAGKGNADTANVKGPTVVRFFQKEAYVSDGYGNRRVIVFDADTMAFKRMWGAFGNVPKDGPQRDPAREAGWDPGPQQFGLPHGLVVSRDGIVYVADRPNRRIQAFTTQGKYLSQVVISGGRRPQVATDGTSTVALSADPNQQFVYVGDLSPAPDGPNAHQIIVLDRKTMKVIDRFGPAQGAHEMTTDSKGNLYIGGGGRYVFKGVTQKVTTE